jgi:hypothetical protein
MLALPDKLPVGKFSTVNATAVVADNAQPGAVVSVTMTSYKLPFNPVTLLMFRVDALNPV